VSTRSRSLPLGVLGSVLVCTVAACGTGGGADRPVAAASHRSVSTSSSTSTTTSTLPPASSTTVSFAGLRPGDSGPRVSELQQRLAALHYDVPNADGHYGDSTRQAVLAFQKVNGLGRDGVAGPETLGRLANPTTPGPMVAGGGSTRVEVDVARQVLFFYRGDALDKIVPVSTGSGERFCVNGRCSTAVTPGGSFRVRGKVSGWQTGDLGRLYKPSYFNGNIAIHGALSVPAGPASHGCVRVPMSSADWLYAALPVGTPVYVLNGPRVPAPFSSELPPPVATTPTRPPVAPTAPPPPPTFPPPTAPPPTTPPTTTGTTAPPSTTTPTTVGP